MALRIRESSIDVLMKRVDIPSRSELARRCGMLPQSLNRYLKNRQSPGSATVDKLCEVLGAQPGDFLFHEPDSADEERTDSP
jgi:transcriptional regulator with XRE-family HTH domain